MNRFTVFQKYHPEIFPGLLYKSPFSYSSIGLDFRPHGIGDSPYNPFPLMIILSGRCLTNRKYCVNFTKGEMERTPRMSRRVFVGAIAERRRLGALAHAPVVLARRLYLDLHRDYPRALVGSVAERLSSRSPAGAPPISSRLIFQSDRGFPSLNRFIHLASSFFIV